MRALILVFGVSLGCAPVPDEPAIPAATPEPEPAMTTPAPKPDPDERLAWRWVVHPDDQEFPQVREIHTDDNLLYRFVVGEEQDHARVTKTGSKGRPEWSFDLPREPMPGGFLLLLGDRLFVAQHSHIATGTKVFALDADTGAELWSTDVLGLGPIGHSKYRNRVQLGSRDGAIIVYGHEAQGRYVEALDPETGAMLGNRKVSDAEARAAQ